MSLTQRIRQKITAEFGADSFTLEDQSARHAGHPGSRPGGETHFYLEITSPAFEDLSPVARQRKVYEVLAAEMREGIHALALSLKTPAEKTGV